MTASSTQERNQKGGKTDGLDLFTRVERADLRSQ